MHLEGINIVNSHTADDGRLRLFVYGDMKQGLWTYDFDIAEALFISQIKTYKEKWDKDAT